MKTFMNCERARNVCIVKTLAKLGHFPIRKLEREAWFLSPLRSETQASFKVSLVKNLWYDFGEGKGGSVIDLVMLLKSCSLKESLLFLSENPIPFTFYPPQFPKCERTIDSVISRIQELHKPALLQYLRHRRIPVGIAKFYCREVHYQLNGKEYFSIGLQNHLGGWELRNKFCKNSSSPKSYSYLSNDSKVLIITEGMFDFLSLATLDKELAKKSDIIILNSLAFIKDIEILIPNYKEVFLFLDNDPAGDLATDSLLALFSHSSDRRESYKDYKDLNDKLRNENEIQYRGKKPEPQSFFPSRLIMENNSISPDDLEPKTAGSEEDVLSSNSRCVPVGTKMIAPGGRKKKKMFKAKRVFIKFRCSVYEKKLLLVKAKRSGLTLSEYIRRVTMEKDIKERLTEDHLEIYKTLVKFHNNFKYIGNMFRQKNPGLSNEVYNLAEKIKLHLQKIEK